MLGALKVTDAQREEWLEEISGMDDEEIKTYDYDTTHCMKDRQGRYLEAARRKMIRHPDYEANLDRFLEKPAQTFLQDRIDQIKKYMATDGQINFRDFLDGKTEVNFVSSVMHVEQSDGDDLAHL